MIADHDLLHAIAHTLVVPAVLADELLQRPHRHARLQRDRLHALARQIGKLPLDVFWKMRPRITAAKAIIELGQKNQ